MEILQTDYIFYCVRSGCEKLFVVEIKTPYKAFGPLVWPRCIHV